MATSNSLITLEDLKDALGLESTKHNNDRQLEMAINSVARQFSNYMRRRMWSATETRYYTAQCTTSLLVDDVLAITSITLDTDGDSSYDTTMSATCYHLTPYNATMQDPPEPFTGIEIADNSSAVFPRGVTRGVKITGTFGYCLTTDCPPDIKAAAIFQARSDFNLSLAGDGAGGNDFSADQSGPKLPGLHPATKRVLDSYRRRTVL